MKVNSVSIVIETGGEKYEKKYNAILIDRNGFIKKIKVTEIEPILYIVDRKDILARKSKEPIFISERLTDIFPTEKKFYLIKEESSFKKLVYREA